MLRHWSQFVPNMSTDIRGHEALPIIIIKETLSTSFFGVGGGGGEGGEGGGEGAEKGILLHRQYRD